MPPSNSHVRTPQSSSCLSLPFFFVFGVCPPSVRSSSFRGAHLGYVYKMGSNGLGYYRDEQSIDFHLRKGGSAVAPPSRGDIETCCIHRRGSEAPHSVEVQVQVGDRVKSASDVTLRVEGRSRCVIESRVWNGKVEVDLMHPIQALQSQGWLEDGRLVARFPISAL